MGNRLSKIYTRTGDDGTTGLANGDRVSKADHVFKVMGEVDELNAHLGMIAAHLSSLPAEDSHLPLSQTDNTLAVEHDDTQSKIKSLLVTLSILQHLLFNVGGELAMPEYEGISATHIEWLEGDIDQLNETLGSLKEFILPAGSMLVSTVHIARTVCRRAEREAVALKEHKPSAISQPALKLLNRLSDWLFVLSRYCAKLEGSKEVLWDKTILDRFLD